MTKGRWILMVGLAAVGAALAGFWLARELHSTEPRLASGTWLPQARELGDFALVDEEGRALTRGSLEGRPTLVFFGFTHCPDVCPTTLATLAKARKEALVDALRVLLISVDPQRDTPQALKAYVHAFDPDFAGATGPAQAIEAVTRRFSVAVQRVEQPGGDYTMDHSAAVFLLDARARLVAVFSPPVDAALLAADLRAAGPHLDSR
jgi:protein SCO1/2